MPEACERRNSVHVGPPRRGAGPRPWREEDRTDGGRRDPDAQLHQLPADPLVTPPGILPTEAEDEVPDLGLDRWSTGAPSPFVRPLLPDELTVPAEQVSGLTTNEDHRPLDIVRLAAASRSRSRWRKRGRFTCRCSTFTWCRSTRSSMSFPSCRRLRPPSRRRTRKYTSESSVELPSSRRECMLPVGLVRTWVSEPFKVASPVSPGGSAAVSGRSRRQIYV
jgi:hypothetical protein